MKPIKEPNAGFIELLGDLPSNISPRKAPTIGPIISPNGGKKNSPKNNPIAEPQIPFLDPLNFFVAQTGKILSITAENIANSPKIIKNSTENGCLEVN